MKNKPSTEMVVRTKSMKPAPSARLEREPGQRVRVPAWEMFRFCDWKDGLLYLLGAIGAFANGSCNVLMTLVLGDLFNAINFSQSVDQKALEFVYIGIGAFFAATLQVFCFNLASERVTIKIRRLYLESLLKQDITFFDVKNSGVLASSVAENSVVFKDAIGEKLGTALQFIGMFIAGFVVGFTHVYDLALVVLGVVPILGTVGAIFSRLVGNRAARQTESYAGAGAIVEESLAQIRTVASLHIEKQRIEVYEANLLEAKRFGRYISRVSGMTMGTLYICIFGAYALGLFYGSVVIARDQARATNEYPLNKAFAPPYCKVGGAIPQVCSSQNTTGLIFESDVDVCNCPRCGCGCWSPKMTGFVPSITKEATWTCATGGAVFTTFVSILMGAMSIGQAAPGLSSFNNGRTAAAAIYAIIDRKPQIDKNGGKSGQQVQDKKRKKGRGGDGGTPPQGEEEDVSLNKPGGAAASSSFVSTGGYIAVDFTKVKGEIDFEDVHFTYPSRPDAAIFTGLSLHVPAGKTTALVGESGSGKSSIISLIERFYDPLSGRVLLDKLNIRDIDPRVYRSLFGYVGQEPTLFATSIKGNILFGTNRENVPMEDMVKAAKAANAHDFISAFPDGYDTLVGGAGSQLSGGQKQRIAIARALVRDPKVLLLDEATSALDNESERVVQAAIDEMIARESRTTIIIAHRMSTVKNADLIVVLGKGKVIEQGNHSTLMAAQGTYAALVSLSGGKKGAGEEGAKQPIQVVDATPVDPEQSSNEDAIKVELESSESAADLDEPAQVEGVLMRNVETAGGDIASAITVAISAATEESDAPTPDEKKLKPEQFVSISNLNNAGSDSPSLGGDAASKKEEEEEDGKANKKKTKKKREPRVPMRRIMRFVRPDLKWFLPGIFFACASGVTFPVFAILLSSVIDSFFRINVTDLLSGVQFWALMFLVLGGATGFANACQSAIFGYIASNTTSRVRSATFGSLIRRHVGYFDYKENSVGALTTTLASDAALVKTAVVDQISVTIQNLSTIVAGLTVAFIASWQMTAVILGVFPVLALSMRAAAKVLRGIYASDSHASAEAGQILSESVMGIRTVTALGLQTRVVNLYTSFLEGPMKQSIRKGLTAGLAFGFGQLIPFLTRALAFWYGGKLIENKELTFQNFIQSFLGILMMAISLGQTAAGNADIAKGVPAIRSVFRIIDAKSDIDPLEEEAGLKPSGFMGSIDFVDVSFAYPTRPTVHVLKNFNLKIGHGQTVALVGPSGSGKSTIILLLERFFDPIAGQVLLDGNTDVRSVNVGWLRSQLGLVGQEPALFAGTIRENILNGRPNASDEEVMDAARNSNCYDFVMNFPDKFETTVGNKGAQLSGGQKQRIAIARAILRNPKVLLLDEATSALDNESEAVVQKALDELLEKQSRTTIIVAHRLSTVRSADKIVVLDKGVTVEQGRYDELLARGGAFAKLYSAQQRQKA